MLKAGDLPTNTSFGILHMMPENAQDLFGLVHVSLVYLLCKLTSILSILTFSCGITADDDDDDEDIILCYVLFVMVWRYDILC